MIESEEINQYVLKVSRNTKKTNNATTHLETYFTKRANAYSYESCVENSQNLVNYITDIYHNQRCLSKANIITKIENPSHDSGSTTKHEYFSIDVYDSGGYYRGTTDFDRKTEVSAGISTYCAVVSFTISMDVPCGTEQKYIDDSLIVAKKLNGFNDEKKKLINRSIFVGIFIIALIAFEFFANKWLYYVPFYIYLIGILFVSILPFAFEKKFFKKIRSTIIISFCILGLGGFMGAALLASPTEISSIKDFKRIENQPFASYVLTQDIDFSDVDSFNGISYYFGVLDGNNHTISNIHIYAMLKKNLGVFNSLQGTVKNLNFENIRISATGAITVKQIGTIAGKAQNATIINCTISGELDPGCSSIGIGDKNYYVGGLIGGGSAKISDCDVTLNIGIRDSYIKSMTSDKCKLNVGAVSGKNSIEEIEANNISYSVSIELTSNSPSSYVPDCINRIDDKVSYYSTYSSNA